jgi:membrane-bound inhibitor of C-type lysozyme
MRQSATASRLLHAAAVAATVSLLLCAACAMPLSKEEQEAAKNTFACLAADERIVIRVDIGEARLLMPDGDRIALYQIPTASGVRYSNGNMELRGKGMDLQLVRNGVATPLNDCQPLSAPK